MICQPRKASMAWMTMLTLVLSYCREGSPNVFCSPDCLMQLCARRRHDEGRQRS